MSRELEIRYRLARMAASRRDEWMRPILYAWAWVVWTAGAAIPCPRPPHDKWWSSTSIDDPAKAMARLMAFRGRKA